MKIFNHSEQFQNALNNNDHIQAEAVLSASDIKKEIIKDCVSNGSNHALLQILPSFKSKGLVKNIEMMMEKLQPY